MAQAAIETYKVRIRKSGSTANGRATGYNYTGGGGQLYQAARQTDQRKFVLDNNREIHRNVTAFGRRTLATLGRNLYANNPIVRGAINEMADYSVGTWIPQYYGRNPAWGNLAEDWLYEHDKICNLDGGNMHDYLTNLVRAVHVTGDIATIYTETDSGYPQLQQISGHRIRSDEFDGIVKEGWADGAVIIDGVIVDGYGAPVGYRIYTEDTWQDVPASGCMLHFIHEYEGQLRGLSQLASAVFPFQDIHESNALELMAQRGAARRGFLIHNEDGEADPTKQVIGTPSTVTNDDGTKAQSYTELIDGVIDTYVKAGTNSKIEEVKHDRPTQNVQAFKLQQIREALQGIGWNIDFTLDPTKSGGVNGRIIVEKINKTINAIQKKLAIPASSRFNFFRVSKAIKLGQLPPDVDSWKFGYQGPARITSDEKYSSDVAIQEIRACIKSPQQACAERNEYWEEVQDRAIAFEKRLQEKCKAEGVDPNRIVLLTPNGNAAIAPNQPAQTQGTP